MELEQDSLLFLELNTTCEPPLLVPTLIPTQINTTNTTIIRQLLEKMPGNLTASSQNYVFYYHNAVDADKEVTGAMWVCGLVTVAATALLPVLGFAFHPFQKRRWFGQILLFFVAQTACHVLSMALLVYLPKALNIDLSHDRVGFVRITMVIFITVLLCFNMEIFHCQTKSPAAVKCKMRNALKIRRSRKGWYYCWRRNNNRLEERDISIIGINNSSSNNQPPTTTSTSDHSLIVGEHHEIANIPEPSLPRPKSAYFNFNEELPLLNSASALLYIFAECLVTFVDGFRIGSALLNSGLATGIAVSFVIFTEETPRKIGGIALLRYIGAHTVGQAIGCSMIASCFLFIGFVTGAFMCAPFYYKLLSPWGYAIALAFFLHVCLIIVMPAMLNAVVHPLPIMSTATKNDPVLPHNRSPDCQLKLKDGRFTVNVTRMFIVNLGLIVGCSISLVLCIYAESLPYMNST